MDELMSCGGCEHIGRREFLSKSALAAVTLALAACAAGDATGPSLGTGNNASIKVSDYAALANVNGVATFTLSGTPIAVVHTGTDTYQVLSRVCPHQGGTIQAQSGGFTCPVHGARFSLNGTWTGGERTSNMRTIASSYDATTGTLKIG